MTLEGHSQTRWQERHSEDAEEDTLERSSNACERHEKTFRKRRARHSGKTEGHSGKTHRHSEKTEGHTRETAGCPGTAKLSNFYWFQLNAKGI